MQVPGEPEQHGGGLTFLDGELSEVALDDDEATSFLAMACRKLERPDEARSWYDRAVKWADEGHSRDPDLPRLRAEAAQVLGVR